jgi:hypothetical protein
MFRFSGISISIAMSKSELRFRFQFRLFTFDEIGIPIEVPTKLISMEALSIAEKYSKKCFSQDRLSGGAGPTVRCGGVHGGGGGCPIEFHPSAAAPPYFPPPFAQPTTAVAEMFPAPTHCVTSPDTYCNPIHNFQQVQYISVLRSRIIFFSKRSRPYTQV